MLRIIRHRAAPPQRLRYTYAMNDITSLQQTLTDSLTSNVTSNVQGELEKIMVWVLIPSIVITFVLLAAYIAHVVHRHKVDKAIFEIRDTLREMKLAQVSPAKPAFPAEALPAAEVTAPVEAETEVPTTQA